MVIRKYFRSKSASVCMELYWTALILRLFLPFRFDVIPDLIGSISFSKIESILSKADNGLLNSSSIFSDAAIRINSEGLSFIECLQVLGIFAAVIFIFLYFISMHRIFKSIVPLKETTFHLLLKTHFNSNNRRRKLSIYAGRGKTPYLIGIFNAGIVLPFACLQKENKHLEAVICHESVHFKHYDNLKLFILCILQCLFFYNPVIHLIALQYRKDIEYACDEAVLRQKTDSFSLSYINSIVYFASRRFYKKSYLSGFPSGKNLNKRIKHLCNINKNRISYVGVIFLLCSLVFSFTSINKSNQIISDYSYQYIKDNGDGYKIVLNYLDSEKSGYFINTNTCLDEVNGASIIKVPMSLIIIETSNSENNYLVKWDGGRQPYNFWEQDHDLETALRYSVSWYYDKIFSNDMTVKLSELLHNNGYSGIAKNSIFETISENKISPYDQTVFLSKIYANEFSRKPDSLEKLKKIMYRKKINGYIIYGKTGTAIDNSGKLSGWFTGYAEKDGQTIVFSIFNSEQSGREVESYAYKHFDNNDFREN